MKINYFKTIALGCLLAGTFSAKAQYNEVLKASQFGGVSNVNYNPAIADNRMKFDMNLISAGFSLENNYVGINPKAFFDQSLFDDKDFQSKYLKERLNGKTKQVFLGAQVQGPLSFMFGWGKNKSNKNAIALSWNTNFITNVSGVSETLARSSFWGLGTKADSITNFIGKGLNEKNLAVRSLAWMDVGATYSRVVYDKGPHMIKAGVTGKFLVGVMGVYISSSNVDYKFQDNKHLDIKNSDFSYGHSEIVSDVYKSGGNTIDYDAVKKAFSKPSFAADLGVIYEWRPKKDKYKYEMDCKEWYRRDKNKYTLSAGFSIIDIGRLNFQKPADVRNFTADTTYWYVEKSGIKDVKTFDSVIANNPNNFKVRDSKEEFKVWLPTRFNLFLDYEIYKGLGLNLNGTISPNFAKDRNQVHYPSSVTFTPRYDHAWFGAYIPLTYNSYGNFGAGVGLRMGPIFVTSSNVITALAGKATFNMNLQVGMKITIPNGVHKDKDKDGVSNKKDKCKKLKGTCATEGCPDKDGDGITDDVDQCPDVAGPKETFGCPDRDKDGVIDMNDSCPDVPGLKELNGCPDTDGDGVIDSKDDCPTVAGLKELNGCPDRDKDGVADKDDACPDVPGEKAHAGCPDSDKDGLYDNEDKCPREAGPKENAGCPWPDTDGDGVLDKDDACPKVFGVVENKGCPQLAKKELETIKYAFQNLEFETGKDVIRAKSFPSLSGLAQLLVSKPNYGLKIEGHTDNVGKADMNQELSRKRAEAVKKYLASKGVVADKLETAGYGMTKPIADNATAAGRQKNRRVEMTITFK